MLRVGSYQEPLSRRLMRGIGSQMDARVQMLKASLLVSLWDHRGRTAYWPRGWLGVMRTRTTMQGHLKQPADDPRIQKSSADCNSRCLEVT